MSPLATPNLFVQDRMTRNGPVGPAAMQATPPWRSFWMGGFEGADHINSRGVPLDMVAASAHDQHVAMDYAQLRAAGLWTVRESVGWRLCEHGGRFDFSRAVRFAKMARSEDIQVQWTLMHYGTPSDVSLQDDAFCERFARFAREAALVLGEHAQEPPVYTLINEMSFVSWAVTQTRLMHPYGKDAETAPGTTVHDGFHIKCRLVKAALMGMQAILEVDPRARFLHVEPLVHVVPPAGRPDLQDLADDVCAYQWQVWDMLAGRLLPELGGHEAALDLMGVNHYHSGQWEVLTEKRLYWHLGDPRRKPLAHLLKGVWLRYSRPLIVAETSHVGEGRAAWLEDVAGEVAQALADGVVIQGVCLYPIVDRPDWDNPEHWHHSGLWDHAPGAMLPGAWPRRMNLAYGRALHRWQTRLPRHAGG